MYLNFKPLVLVGGISLALSQTIGAAFAQDAAAPATPPTKDTAKAGEVYLSEKTDPWELRCTKTEDGKDPCQIFQLLKDEAGGDVAEFNFFEIPAGETAAAGAVAVVPLETLLETGLVFQIDSNEPRAYPFAFCNSYGCIAKMGFTPEELDLMRSGSAATLTIVPALAPETKVVLKLSLSGFTDMAEKTKPAQ